jgi:hypothetical protein
MHSLTSKIIGFLIVPSNFIIVLMLCGPLLWRWTRFSKYGQRTFFTGIILLLISKASPLGALLLLPLEHRFQP